MSRIKILYIIGSFGIGGKERQLVELIKGLPKDKYSICLIIKNSTAFYLENINAELDYFYSLSENRFGLRSLFKIYKIIKKVKPEIVHSWVSIGTLLAIIIRLFYNFKLIDGSIRDSNSPTIMGRIRVKIIYHGANKVIANSKAGLMAYKIPELKSTFIYNGFDLGRISNLDSRSAVKEKFKINSQKVVGMVARIDVQKDYTTFIKAAVLVLQKKEEILFIIVGDGEGKKELQLFIPSVYRDKFIFTGNQKNVESIVNCFDIAILSTFREGISNSIMEYMALGKPVVATDGGGTSELVKDGVTGFLVKGKDEQQLAEKILLLLDHKDICLLMGIEGEKRIIEKFNFKNMINRYQLEYENIINP
jgi:glycosyltransferase involved in cell wall biosynthesis